MTLFKLTLDPSVRKWEALMAMQLLKFGAEWCSACKAMTRQKTLEKFAEAHPEVKVRKLDLYDEDDDPPEGREAIALAKEAAKLEKRYGIRALPTLIFTDGDGEELARVDHSVVLTELEKLFKQAKAECNDQDEDGDEDQDDT